MSPTEEAPEKQHIFLNESEIDSIKREASTATLIKVFGGYKITKESIFEAMPNRKEEIIFLGNSITDNCNWHELLGNPNVINRGISGDKIEGILSRLDEIVESKPKKIFLMVGINDFRKKRTSTQILMDYERLIKEIKEKTSHTELYIQSILPTKMKGYNNKDIIKVNNGLKQLSIKHRCEYINLFDLFKDDNNEMNMEFSIEGIHLNGKGYLLWKEAIVKYVKS